ncbi:uncharacterized protein LOC141853682 [Brevipalpus obovatus]|uniref:uncharacterized protein LOC141853682 n=1 Tax=Brevipalpus obovatus TaxID=246614 RepID=UPI003D9E78F6
MDMRYFSHKIVAQNLHTFSIQHSSPIVTPVKVKFVWWSFLPSKMADIKSPPPIEEVNPRKSSLKSVHYDLNQEPTSPIVSQRKISVISHNSLNSASIYEEDESESEPEGQLNLGREKTLDEEKGKISNLAQSNVLAVFRCVIVSLKILGLWPRENDKFSKKMNPQSWIVFIYLHVYAAHNILNWGFSYYRTTGGFHIFLENASMVIRTSATAMTFDIFFAWNQQIIKSLVMISYYPFTNTKISLMSLKNPILFLILASWAYLALILATQSWSTATMGSQKFMDYYFYGLKVRHVNEVLMRFLMAGVWIAHISITLSAEIFLKTFYVAACFLLSKTAEAYNNIVSEYEKNEIVVGDDLNRVNKLHTRLTDLVLGVDKSFSLCAFIWVATIFLNLCTKIGIICITTDPSWMMNASVDIINYLIIFIVITLTASNVSLQCERLLPMAHKLAAKADMKDLTVLYQAKLMIAKMSHPVARLTGWNCFVLDRPFILTIIGTILTYSVVLMQMSRSGESGSKVSKQTFFNALFNQTSSFE